MNIELLLKNVRPLEGEMVMCWSLMAEFRRSPKDYTSKLRCHWS